MRVPSLRSALRRLMQSPVYALAVILTLALSIGANTAVFSLVNALLLRPLPYPEPDRLAGIGILSNLQPGGMTTRIDGETWFLIQQQVPQIQAAVSSGRANPVNVRTSNGVQSALSLRVSSGFFGTLDEPPAIGREFTAVEDADGGPKAVILSNPFWRNAFNSDPKILGQSIVIKGAPHTVVGVLGPRFQLPSAADVYTPIQPSRTAEGSGTNYHLIARLKTGISWQQADAALAQVRPQMLRYHLMGELRPGEQRTLEFLPLAHDYSEQQRAPALALLVATGFIVLIACANLASLTLVRMRRRSYELATRLALGAGRWQILRQLWVESASLALLGGVAGIATAEGLLRALLSLLPLAIVPLGGVALDGRVLLFTAAVSIGTSLLFGMLPALTVYRLEPVTVLGQRNMGAPRGSRARQVLIAAEVALAVVLLAGSGLLTRSLVHLETLPPGFDAHGVFTAQASLDEAQYDDPAQFVKLMRESVAAMERIPGVTHAAVGLSLPYQRALNTGVTPKDGKQAGQQFTTDETYVTPEYFGALGIHLRSGRVFSDGDTASSQPVAIVNENFARQILHDRNPVGRMIDQRRIVGVISDVQATPGIDEVSPIATEQTVYLPATQVPADTLAVVHIWFQPSWIIRSNHLNAATPAAMQRALSSVDPNLPFASFHTMDELLATALSQQRIEVALLTALAVLALLLAGLGIFALVSSVITDRQREFGIRLALGSPRTDTIALAGRAGALPAAVGLAAGVALAFVVLRMIASALFGVTANDPWTLAVTVMILLALAILASLLPALRILRIEPATVLRAE